MKETDGFFSCVRKMVTEAKLVSFITKDIGSEGGSSYLSRLFITNATTMNTFVFSLHSCSVLFRLPSSSIRVEAPKVVATISSESLSSATPTITMRS